MVDPCAIPNCRSYYLSYEALWLERIEDQSFSLSQGRFMNGFNYNQTARYTLARCLIALTVWNSVIPGPSNGVAAESIKTLPV